jgi:hypothetical protein
MKQLLLEVDDEIAARLERVAPARSRQRSEFLRNAIRQALWELEERATAQAYARQPDVPTDTHWDPATWEPVKAAPRKKKPRTPQ